MLGICECNTFRKACNPSQNILRPACKFIELTNSLYHNQHCPVGGRGGTIILSYGRSHNFCDGLSEI